ncbi:MAG: gamma-glutamyl-phosphate reductase, partial [Rhodospirillales bacterium]|nr:gamma-glutamyl-phosphate reductase [Rhodospirillales bacterium]
MSDNKNITEVMQEIGKAAKDTAQTLVNAPAEAKNRALTEAATSLRDNSEAITQANYKDMAVGEEKGLTSAMLDRLELNEDRISGMAAGLEAIAELNDPVGSVMENWDRPNGLSI